jgi:hypothetical protein
VRSRGEADEVEEAFARNLLDTIDQHLRVSRSRETFSRAEHLDALLELRSLAADLFELQHLDHAYEESPGPRHRKFPSRRRAVRSRSG